MCDLIPNQIGFLAYVRHFCTMSLHIYFSIHQLSFLSIQLTGGQCGSYYKECMWPPKGWPLCPQAVYVVPQEMTPCKFSSDPLWCWQNWWKYFGSAAGYYQILFTCRGTVFTPLLTLWISRKYVILSEASNPISQFRSLLRYSRCNQVPKPALLDGRQTPSAFV